MFLIMVNAVKPKAQKNQKGNDCFYHYPQKKYLSPKIQTENKTHPNKKKPSYSYVT